MNPPKQVEQLVERFDRNKDQYNCGNCDEAQLRQGFVNPFSLVHIGSNENFPHLTSNWIVDNLSRITS